MQCERKLLDFIDRLTIAQRGELVCGDTNFIRIDLVRTKGDAYTATVAVGSQFDPAENVFWFKGSATPAPMPRVYVIQTDSPNAFATAVPIKNNAEKLNTAVLVPLNFCTKTASFTLLK